MIMSSYFACTHVFDPIFSNLISEIYEYSKTNRCYHVFEFAADDDDDDDADDDLVPAADAAPVGLLVENEPRKSCAHEAELRTPVSVANTAPAAHEAADRGEVVGSRASAVGATRSGAVIRSTGYPTAEVASGATLAPCARAAVAARSYCCCCRKEAPP